MTRGTDGAFQALLSGAHRANDSLLCVGVFLMIVYSMMTRPSERPSNLRGFEPKFASDAKSGTEN